MLFYWARCRFPDLGISRDSVSPSNLPDPTILGCGFQVLFDLLSEIVKLSGLAKNTGMVVG